MSCVLWKCNFACNIYYFSSFDIHHKVGWLHEINNVCKVGPEEVGFITSKVLIVKQTSCNFIILTKYHFKDWMTLNEKYNDI